MTETTEHITESYVRYILGWFTNSNIKSKNGKEIDILAVDKNGNKYWIECGVTITNFKFRSKSKRSPLNINPKTGKNYEKWIDKNGLDYFIHHKFKDPNNLNKIKEFGFNNNYKKIVVVWEIGEELVRKKAKEEKIEIWELKKIIKEMINKMGKTYYADDILRTLQLVKESRENE